MYTAHKIELKLNNKQKTYMAKACGVARFSWNWALIEWKKMYEAHKKDETLPKPNQYLLRKKLNSIKKEQFPWMAEISKCVPQMSIIHLGTAFKRYFDHIARHPKLKKKGHRDSFTITNDLFTVKDKKLKIPKIGELKLREKIRFDKYKLISLTISRVADRWFASFTLEVENIRVENQGANVKATGVDLGIKSLATLSDGAKIDAPKPLKKLLKRLRFLQKSLHRKVLRSSNRRKAKFKLARLYAKIANIRSDFLHKLTNNLVKEFSLIGIENLNVSGMMKNKKLSRAISDLGFYEFKRQLQYKAERLGIKLVVADAWFPSSKLCSECGHRLENLELDERVWICPECGHLHDRDINAALNLRDYAVSCTVCSLSRWKPWLNDPAFAGNNHIVSETSVIEAGIQHQL